MHTRSLQVYWLLRLTLSRWPPHYLQILVMPSFVPLFRAQSLSDIQEQKLQQFPSEVANSYLESIEKGVLAAEIDWVPLTFHHVLPFVIDSNVFVYQHNKLSTRIKKLITSGCFNNDYVDPNYPHCAIPKMSKSEGVGQQRRDDIAKDSAKLFLLVGFAGVSS